MLRRLFGLFLGVLLLGGAACAETNPVLLTVSGNIGKVTDKARKVYEFRESDLRSLKQRAIVTKTSWTPESTFSGPLMSEVLNKVGAAGSQVKFQALNDYAYTVSREELEKYNVILARTINNKPMAIKDRGPLWLMYPVADMPTAQRGPLLDAKLIWQVNRIVVY